MATSLGQDFGQRIDLSTKIREILLNYDSSTVTKELIQNADDAGARVVRFCFDKRSHGTKDLAYPGLNTLQGPSLVVFNDGEFSDGDLESIQHIGGSKKREALGKTGRFGVGFNSTYHLTEVPSFLSRNKLVYFDPQAKYLPCINPHDPGKIINFTEKIKRENGESMLVEEAYPDQFLPWKIFGCTLKEPFKGTIFRFPLRTREQARDSKLSKNDAAMKGYVEALFSSLVEVSSSILLFLKHVEKVELYEIDEQAGPGATPVLLHTVSIVNISADLRRKRSLLGTAVREVTVDGIKQLAFTDVADGDGVYEMNISHEELSGGQCIRRVNDTWVVASYLGTGPSREMAQRPDLLHLRLVPWSGVAAQVHRNGEPVVWSEKDGRAFCFLPLPVLTGLPVHVNGFFELSSNRRDIWYGDDMAGEGAIRSTWNRNLLLYSLAPCYARLVVALRDYAGVFGQGSPVDIDRFYHYWPRILGGMGPWKLLTDALFEQLAHLPVVSCGAPHANWISCKDALFLEAAVAPKLHAPLLKCMMPAVVLSPPLNGFIECCPRHSQVVTAELVRRYTRSALSPQSGTGKSSALQEGEVISLLEFALSDLGSSNKYAEMVGVPLLPLEDGTRSSFGPNGSEEFYLVPAGDAAHKILTSLRGKIVSTRVGDAVYAHLKKPEFQRAVAVVSMSPRCIPQLLPLCLPKAWHSNTVVSFPGDGNSNVTMEWMHSLWQYLDSHKASPEGLLDGWPLLPVEGHLVACGWAARCVELDESVTSDLRALMHSVGCYICLPDFRRSSAWIKGATQDGSVVGMLGAIGAAAEGNLDIASKNVGKQSARYRDALRVYFTDTLMRDKAGLEAKLPRAHGQPGKALRDAMYALLGDMNVWLLRSLPIYRTFSHDEGDFVCLDSELEKKVRYLSPDGIDLRLFDVDFILTETDDQRLFFDILGVETMGRADVYERYFLARVSLLGPEVRRTVALSMLHEWGLLSHAEPQLRRRIALTAFIPTPSGELMPPNRLYDPEVAELKGLVDPETNYPDAEFADTEILIVLRALGMRVSMDMKGILDSAMSISLAVENAAEKEGGDDHSLSQRVGVAGRLFRYLDDRFDQLKATSGETFAPMLSCLVELSWIPALHEPPSEYYPRLKTARGGAKLVPPMMCRPVEDAPYASASYHLMGLEVHSRALREAFGWSQAPSGEVLATQIVAYADLHKGSVEAGAEQDLTLRNQSMSTIIPKMYQMLEDGLQSNAVDTDKVATVLQEKPWVWVGDQFVTAVEVAFKNAIDARPYLYVVPADLTCFQRLLRRMGVREGFTSNDFCGVLAGMAAELSGETLSKEKLSLSILLAQQLADSSGRIDGHVYLPSSTGLLVERSGLVYDDMPWLPCDGSTAGSGTDVKYLHAKISQAAAVKLGVSSRRQNLLVQNVDFLDSGIESAEAFGQQESLTRRLAHILEQYADGPGIIHELIQNADDAGATEVAIMYSSHTYGQSSILSPKMSAWQGPSLYFYNNSVFTQQDIYAVSRIGQGAKLSNVNSTGRFGLGFNAVYHFTDVPSFVSGDNLVMFDPHVQHLPGATSAQPGLKFSYCGKGLAEKFPDQFEPYKFFGCDMSSSFPGTLFRFPLRGEETATLSHIKRKAYTDHDIHELLESFKKVASETLLFLRNVKKVSVYTCSSESDSNRECVYSVQVEGREVSPLKAMLESKGRSGTKNAPLATREAFLSRLAQMPEKDLPQVDERIDIVYQGAENESHRDTWVLQHNMCGGDARRIAIQNSTQQMRLIPIASVAAHLLRDGNAVSDSLRGRAFSFLPLPIFTGLPVHVNGFFELSSNRRDIWYGDDMAGEGRLKSEWNHALLRDAVGRVYAQLLLHMSKSIGRDFFAYWPHDFSAPAGANVHFNPWRVAIASVYKYLVNKPVLYSDIGGGTWVSAQKAVFVRSDHEALVPVLLKEGIPVVVVTPTIDQLVTHAEDSVQFATPALVRTVFRNKGAAKAGELSSDDAIKILEFCLSDLNDESYQELHGLRLVPLSTGRLGYLLRPETAADAYEQGRISTPYLIATSSPLEASLMKVVMKDVVVDTQIMPSSVLAHLNKESFQNMCSVRKLNPFYLSEIMGVLLPPNWKGETMVSLKDTDIAKAGRGPDGSGQSWLELFWQYLKDSDANPALFDEWPIIPCMGDILIPARAAPCLVESGALPSGLQVALRKVGCRQLDHTLTANHPWLAKTVRPGTAHGVLEAIGFSITWQGGLDISKRLEGEEWKMLRTFFASRLSVDGADIDESGCAVLRMLPLCTLVNGDMVSAVDHTLFQPPEGIDARLLNIKTCSDTFVVNGSPLEVDLMNFIGIERMEVAHFYADFVVPELGNMEPAVRDHIMTNVLRNLPRLCKEDPALPDRLSKSAFVPTRSGRIFEPHMLFDPVEDDMARLLDPNIHLPASPYDTADILIVLRSLGLRSRLGQRGVLESAMLIGRSWEDIKAVKEEGSDLPNSRVVLEKAKDLLRYVDLHYADLVEESHSSDDDDESPSHTFAQRLHNISWMPVHCSPSVEFLPWPSGGASMPPVAPPKIVRPFSDHWLVSGTFRLLDGEVLSGPWREALGWNKKPECQVVAAQLVSLADRFLKEHGSAQTSLPAESDQSDALRSAVGRAVPQVIELLDETIRHEAAPAQTTVIGEDEEDEDSPPTAALDSLTQGPSCEKIRSILSGHHWMWTGSTFISPKRSARRSILDVRPYLYEVPASLQSYESFLQVMDVKREFGAEEYVSVLEIVAQESGPTPVTDEILDLVVSICNHAQDKVTGRLVYLPDAEKIMRRSNTLTYDDAPWLSSTASRRFIHPRIPNTAAASLGAQSLRSLIVANKMVLRDLPCASVDLVRNTVLPGMSDLAVLSDVINAADASGARSVHFILDMRTHGTESLLSPGLADLQGPALVIYLPDVALSSENISVLFGGPARKDENSTFKFAPLGRTNLVSTFMLTEAPMVMSQYCLYIFDPTGERFGDAPSSSTNTPRTGSGKAYPFLNSDLPIRFPDQFRPFDMFGMDTAKAMDTSSQGFSGTLIRLPLRQAAHPPSPLFSDSFRPHGYSGMDADRMMDRFQDWVPRCFVFLANVENIVLSEWLASSSSPSVAFDSTVMVNPTLRSQRAFMTTTDDWRKQKLMNFLVSYHPQVVKYPIRVVSHDRKKATDSAAGWLVCGVVGAGKSRDMALDRRYAQRRWLPVGGVAAQVEPAPSPKGKPESGAVYSFTPVFPCASRPDLEVPDDTSTKLTEKQKMFADEEEQRAKEEMGSKDGWEEDDDDVPEPPKPVALDDIVVEEETLPNHLALPSGVPILVHAAYEVGNDRNIRLASSGAFGHDAAMVWNREVHSCVLKAYVDLMLALRDSFSQSLSSIYCYWPFPANPPSSHTGDVLFGRPHRYEVLEQLSRKPLFLLTTHGMRNISDGYFLTSRRLNEGSFLENEEPLQDNDPALEVINFVRRFGPAFEMPVHVSENVMGLGLVGSRPLTPKSLRASLQANPSHKAVASAMPLEAILLLLKYCFSDIEQTNANYAALRGIAVMPLATGGVAMLGRDRCILATREEQRLFGSSGPDCFVNERVTGVESVMSHLQGDAFLQTYKASFSHFSPTVLAQSMSEILPPAWQGQASVPWTPGSDNHPSEEWLLEFWGYVAMQPRPRHTLGLFEAWPLIPLTGRRLGRAGMWTSAVVAKEDSSCRNIASALTSLGVPVVDVHYIEPLSGVLGHGVGNRAGSTNAQEEAMYVLSKMAMLHGAQQMVLDRPEISDDDRERLCLYFASNMPQPEGYDDESRALLRALPIFETAGSSANLRRHVSLTGGDRFMFESHPYFKPSPDDDRFVAYGFERFYSSLGVKTLSESEIFEQFVMPTFSDRQSSQQEDIISYLKSNWDMYRTNRELARSITKVPFLRASEGSRPICAGDLFDPTNPILAAVFKDDTDRFPPAKFQSEDWLGFLREVGLRQNIDNDTLLECARRVETSASRDKALMLLDYLKANYSKHNSKAICTDLAEVRFLPISHPLEPGRLVAFAECCMPADHSLVWLSKPVLPSDAMPPKAACKHFGIRSPPSPEDVYQNISTMSSETLIRWPLEEPIASVFMGIYDYLCGAWDEISADLKVRWRSVPLVPVGDRLVKASRVFFRMESNLAPFLFELPRQFGSFEDLFSDLGTKSSPDYMDYISFLKELRVEIGDSTMNPNELKAVLNVVEILAASSLHIDEMPSILVPNDCSRLVPANECFFNDEPWLKGRVVPGKLNFVNPRLSARTATKLGVRWVSQVVVERLADGFAPSETSSSLSETLNSTMHSDEFSAALVRLVRNQLIAHKGAGESTSQGDDAASALSRSETAVADVKDALSQFSTVFVERILSRFYLLPDMEDITLEEEGSLSFVDQSKGRVYLAVPREGFRESDELARVVNRLLGGPIVDMLPLSAALSCHPPDTIDALMNTLRVAEDISSKEFSQHRRGIAGETVQPEDHAMIFYKPLGPFFTGEIVAWQDQAHQLSSPVSHGIPPAECLKYGTIRMAGAEGKGLEVDSDSQVVKRFDVTISTDGSWQEMLSTDIYGFRSGTTNPTQSSSTGPAESKSHPQAGNSAPKKQGWLSAMVIPTGVVTGAPPKWKKRFCCLREGQNGVHMWMFKSATLDDLQGTVLLKGATIQRIPGGSSHRHRFSIQTGSGEQSLRLCANSDEEVEEWILVLNAASAYEPLPNRRTSVDQIAPKNEEVVVESTETVEIARGPRPVGNTELVGAIGDILRRAGLPLNMDQHNLLEELVSSKAKATASAKEVSSVREENRRLAEDLRKSNARLEAIEAAFQCQICFGSTVTLIIEPCAHLICDMCMANLPQQSCPFCRKEISKTIPFYNSTLVEEEAKDSEETKPPHAGGTSTRRGLRSRMAGLTQRRRTGQGT